MEKPSFTDVQTDSEEIFSEVEEARKSGHLSAMVSSAAFRYQSSEDYPGYLERIDANGQKQVGLFQNGRFWPIN